MIVLKNKGKITIGDLGGTFCLWFGVFEVHPMQLQRNALSVGTHGRLVTHGHMESTAGCGADIT